MSPIQRSEGEPMACGKLFEGLLPIADAAWVDPAIDGVVVVGLDVCRDQGASFGQQRGDLRDPAFQQVAARNG